MSVRVTTAGEPALFLAAGNPVATGSTRGPGTPLSPVGPLTPWGPVRPPAAIVPPACTSATGSSSGTGYGKHIDTDLAILAAHGAVLVHVSARIAADAANHVVGCIYDPRGRPD